MLDLWSYWPLLTEGGWFPLAWAVTPVATAGLVLWLSHRQPFLRALPAATAAVLFLALVFASLLDTGADLTTVFLGWAVSAVASVVVFIRLRRQSVRGTNSPPGGGGGE